MACFFKGFENEFDESFNVFFLPIIVLSFYAASVPGLEILRSIDWLCIIFTAGGLLILKIANFYLYCVKGETIWTPTAS